MLGQLQISFRLDVEAGTAGDIVENIGQIGCVGTGIEMLYQPCLSWFCCSRELPAEEHRRRQLQPL